jgi:hypothetical protein
MLLHCTGMRVSPDSGGKLGFRTEGNLGPAFAPIDGIINIPLYDKVQALSIELLLSVTW